jgi:hypothetical protein
MISQGGDCHDRESTEIRKAGRASGTNLLTHRGLRLRESRWRAEHAEAIRAENDYIKSMACRWRHTDFSDGTLSRLSIEAGKRSRVLIAER